MTANATLKTAQPVHSPLDAEAEAERRALNRAFRGMGLPWYWEVDDYRELRASGDTAARVRRYVETRHAALLTAYDAEFLGRMVSGILERSGGEDAQPEPAQRFAGSPRPGHGWTSGAHSVDFIA